MRINTNVGALNSWRQLSMTDKAMGTSLERLSSGFRINRAADDAAGLAISEKMKAQINGLNQAIRNAQDGISLIQTAEGGLVEVHDMLQRMRELTMQAKNGTYQNTDLAKMQAEVNQLVKEIDDVATKRTVFNGKVLFNGTAKEGEPATEVPASTTIKLQVGPNTTDEMSVDFSNLTKEKLGEYVSGETKEYISNLSVADTSGWTDDAIEPIEDGIMNANAIEIIDAAIEQVSSERSKLGAFQNRLDHVINNLGVAAENLSAANSRIRDVDMAQEMMSFTRNQILVQAGTAMLAQANARPQSVLQLLG